MIIVSNNARVYVKYVNCCRECPHCGGVVLNGKQKWTCTIHPFSKQKNNVIVTIDDISKILDDCPLEHVKKVVEKEMN